MITILKEIEIPLKEIKEYLNKRSPHELILLLEKEEAILNAKIKQLQKMKNIISEKARITKAARILKFANDKGIDLHGFFYEDVLLDDLSVRGYEEYLIKVSVRISKV
ncbi:hypothetical protein [Paenibacillus sp. TY11]|uniref:hypothetical protein n=1 Tax=Paenibacillus sp. TY11 TaxID=3448633 RepID=UPI00403A153F